MLRSDYKSQDCSISRSLEVVGERWSLLILRSIGMGQTRFDQLQKTLDVNRGVLTSRLEKLAGEGVIEREQYSERPPRFEYKLTQKGKDLWPVLAHLVQWGDAYYCAPGGPPNRIEHVDCGGEPDAHLMCDRCGAALDADNVQVHALIPA